MHTVRQSVEIISYVTGTARSRANQFARALLDADVLPKSSGRSVKQIDPEQLLPLVAAVAMAEKVAEAAVIARAFANLPVQCGDDSLIETGRCLSQIFAQIMDPSGSWKRADIEFSRTAAGYTARINATIVSNSHKVDIELPFRTSSMSRQFCKTSFTISAEGVEVMRHLFARTAFELVGCSLTCGSNSD